MEKGNKKKSINVKDRANNKFIAIAGVSVFIMLVIFFIMFSEAVVQGKVTVKNETDMDIDNIRVYFDNVNSEYYSYYSEEPFYSNDLINSDVKAKSEADGKYEKVKMYNLDAELCVNVTINGEEIEYYNGQFNEDFKGKITVRIFEEDGEVWINIKATTGVFGLFSKVKANTTYKLA